MAQEDISFKRLITDTNAQIHLIPVIRLNDLISFS